MFRHLYQPEAGIQIPGGTVEEGETFAKAVLREASEETGLTGLLLHRFLGSETIDLSPYSIAETQIRAYYHLICSNQPPDTWQHEEKYPSDGSVETIIFDFYWVDLPDGVPVLAGGQGALLEQIQTTR